MNYEEMLDRIYQKLPEKKVSGERFEIPSANSFVEGNKTIVTNFDEVCSKIRRKKEEVAKYLFKEMAVPGSIQGERLVLQGKINAKLLNSKIATYVEQLVICKECKRPDTHIELHGNVKVLVCEACGAKAPVKI